MAKSVFEDKSAQDVVAELYTGRSKAAVRFRFGLLAFDILVIASFILTTIVGLPPWLVLIDVVFAAAIAANTWNGRLYGLPWFVDVGMLYWRTDLVARAPARDALRGDAFASAGLGGMLRLERFHGADKPRPRGLGRRDADRAPPGVQRRRALRLHRPLLEARSQPRRRRPAQR